MKKLLTLIFFAMIFSFANAQDFYGERTAGDKYNKSYVTLDGRSIGDFTVIDSDGIQQNLYSLLEGGYTVIIDLFFTT